MSADAVADERLDAVAAAPASGRRGWRVLVESPLASLLALLGVGLWMNAHAFFGGHLATTVLSHEGDVAQQTWLLAWPAHALRHLVDPFFTKRAFAGSGGVNLLDNPASFSLGLLLAPVTLAIGVTASVNLGLLLCPVLTGMAMWVLLRELGASWPWRIAGALAWGVSPFEVENLQVAHLNLTILVFPPLAAALAHRLVAGTPGRPLTSPRSIGLAAGVLVVVQFFTGQEVLVLTAAAAVLAAAAAAATSYRALRAVADRIVPAAAWCAAVAVPLLLGPALFAMLGPAHYSGSPWPETQIGAAVDALVSAPGAHQKAAFNIGYSGPSGPPQVYLGIGLLVAGVLSAAALWRRRPLARVLVVTAAMLAWLSFGIEPRWNAVRSSVGWGPWRLLYRLPLLEDVSVSRFGVLTYFCLVLLAVLGGIELVRWAAVGLRRMGTPRSATVARTGTFLLALAVAVPVAATYSFPFVTTNGGGEPKWFHHLAATATPSTNVLMVPDELYPTMTWQAHDDFRYALATAYLAGPATSSSSSRWVVPLRGAERTLLALSVAPADAPNPASTAEIDALAGYVRRERITDVVILGRSRVWAAVDLAAALGYSPRRTGGVLVWTRVDRRAAAIPVGSQVLSSCASSSSLRTLLARARCVLATPTSRGSH